MPKIEAVIFDLDGTLIDTVEHVAQAFEQVAKENGREVSRDEVLNIIGPPLLDCYQALLPEHDAAKSADRHHALQQTDSFLELIQEYVGLREMVTALKGKGIKVGVFTNRWRKGVELTFDKLLLTDLFDVVITPDEVEKGKPDPEGLYKIATLFDTTTAHLVMVGDLPVDIVTGKAASVGYTIGITHGFGSRAQLKAAGADYVIDSLGEIEGVIEQIKKI